VQNSGLAQEGIASYLAKKKKRVQELKYPYNAQKENSDNIHCMCVVPLNILFTSKGLSPAMEAFPPSRLNPNPAEVFNNSTQMTSFISRFGSATEYT